MIQVEVVFTDGSSSFNPISNLNNVKRLFGDKIKKINYPEVKEEDPTVKKGKKSATN